MCLLPYITSVTRLSLTCGYWSAPLSHVTTLITCCREVFAQWQLSLCENIHVTVADGSFFLCAFSFSTVYHLTKKHQENIKRQRRDAGSDFSVLLNANINWKNWCLCTGDLWDAARMLLLPDEQSLSCPSPTPQAPWFLFKLSTASPQQEPAGGLDPCSPPAAGLAPHPGEVVSCQKRPSLRACWAAGSEYIMGSLSALGRSFWGRGRGGYISYNAIREPPEELEVLGAGRGVWAAVSCLPSKPIKVGRKRWMDASKRVCSSQHSRCLVNANVYNTNSEEYKFFRTHSSEPPPRHASSSLRVHAPLHSVACGQEKLGIISEGNSRSPGSPSTSEWQQNLQIVFPTKFKDHNFGFPNKNPFSKFQLLPISASKSVLTHRIYNYKQVLRKQPVINSLYSFQIIFLYNTAQQPE